MSINVYVECDHATERRQCRQRYWAGTVEHAEQALTLAGLHGRDIAEGPMGNHRCPRHKPPVGSSEVADDR
jgi:hypothetical protein